MFIPVIDRLTFKTYKELSLINRKKPTEKWTTDVNMCIYCSSCLVAQSCPTLCDPMDCSLPGFPVHHELLELAQTHVLQVGDEIGRAHV